MHMHVCICVGGREIEINRWNDMDSIIFFFPRTQEFLPNPLAYHSFAAVILQSPNVSQCVWCMSTICEQ